MAGQQQQPGSYIQTFPLPSRPLTSATQEQAASGPPANPYQNLVNTFGAGRLPDERVKQTSAAEDRVAAVAADGSLASDSWPSGSRQGPAGPLHSQQQQQQFGVNVLQMVQNVDNYGPIALCILGRDLTREVLNRTTDIASTFKAFQPPILTDGTRQQQQDKLVRSLETMKTVLHLIGRLDAVMVRLQEFRRTMLPEGCENDLDLLIPWADNRSPMLDNLRQETLSRDSYRIAYDQYQSMRQQLQQQNDILGEHIGFLRQCAWDISSMSDQ